MSLSETFTEKFFTVRKPRYNKVSSPEIAATEEEMNVILGRKDVESTGNPSNEGKILVLFIHGFAASKFCWTDPDIGNLGWVKDYHHDPKPIDYGWHAIPPIPFVPIDVTLSEQLVPVGVTELMDRNKIEWLTYSQQSAFGDIEFSVEELKNVMQVIETVFGHRRIIIIAHSRGGLISKRYLDTVQETEVEKLVTLGTPYKGSNMVPYEMLQKPSKAFLNRVKTIRKLWDVNQERRVESISTKQMVPGSNFLKKINRKGCREGIKYVTVAGSSSHITNVYVWRWSLSSMKRQVKIAKEKKVLRDKLQAEDLPAKEWFNLPSKPKIQAFNWTLIPNKILKIFPKIGYKEVLQGDGVVSVDSALLDQPKVKHYIINDNHIEITCSTRAQELMLKEVKLSLKNP